MATRIRLRRVGRKKQSSFRIVVAGGIHPRDGNSTETIGKYNPRTQPTFLEIDEKRALFWLRQGAQASAKVRSLFRQAGILKKFAEGDEGEGVVTIGDEQGKTIIGIEPSRPSRKAEAKAKEAEAEVTSAEAEVEAPEAAAEEAEAAVEEAEAEPEAEKAEEGEEGEEGEAQEPEAETDAEEAEEAKEAEEPEEPEEAEVESPEATAEEAEDEDEAEEEDEEKE